MIWRYQNMLACDVNVYKQIDFPWGTALNFNINASALGKTCLQSTKKIHAKYAKTNTHEYKSAWKLILQRKWIGSYTFWYLLRSWNSNKHYLILYLVYLFQCYYHQALLRWDLRAKFSQKPSFFQIHFRTMFLYLLKTLSFREV